VQRTRNYSDEELVADDLIDQEYLEEMAGGLEEWRDMTAREKRELVDHLGMSASLVPYSESEWYEG
jgi:hypothetical protein